MQARASSVATAAIASSSCFASLACVASGPMPVAISMNESFVEVSPSTVMQLNERSATRLTMPRSRSPETRASVATKPSRVAMSGRIMPAPLAMPVTVASPRESFTFMEAAFATVSVVMMACADEAQSASPSRASGSAAMMRSAGSGCMMTPVEKGRICSGLQRSAAASALQTCMARFTPSAPVPAFALPVLTTSARTEFFRCFLARITGAAQKRLRVNTPATAEPSASRMTRRSLRPGLLTAAIATPVCTPATRCSDAASGGGRFTAISGQLAVAVLVLLARAAGTGVVAPDFLRAAHRGPLLGGRLGDRHVAVAVDPGLVVIRMLQTHVFDVRLVVDLGRLLAVLHVGQGLDHLELDRFHHRAEQLERLALVLLLGILLRVAAQVDALAQVVQRRQVLAPVPVEDLQHDVALGVVHPVLHAGRNLGLVGLGRRGDDALEHRLLAQPRSAVEPFGHRQVEVQLCPERRLQSRHIPLLLDALVGHVSAVKVGHHAGAQVGDALRHVLGLQQLVTQRVYGLALVVGHVVVFQQLLADIEVARLDLDLRALDRARHHAVLDRLALGHLQHHHDAVDAVSGEDAQQRVLERHVEARAARVALPAGAAAQLVVDATRLVSLGADDVQAAGLDHLVVQLLPFAAQLVDARLLFLDRDLFARLDQITLFFDVAAEHDVGAAAGHVGGDGDHAGTAGLRHDLRLARVLLGVEDLVRELFLAEQA